MALQVLPYSLMSLTPWEASSGQLQPYERPQAMTIQKLCKIINVYILSC